LLEEEAGGEEMEKGFVKGYVCTIQVKSERSERARCAQGWLDKAVPCLGRQLSSLRAVLIQHILQYLIIRVSQFTSAHVPNYLWVYIRVPHTHIL
jgi:hypothetical protein